MSEAEGAVQREIELCLRGPGGGWRPRTSSMGQGWRGHHLGDRLATLWHRGHPCWLYLHGVQAASGNPAEAGRPHRGAWKPHLASEGPRGPREEVEPEGAEHPDTTWSKAAADPSHLQAHFSVQHLVLAAYHMHTHPEHCPRAPRDASAHDAGGCVHPVGCWGPRA